MVANIGYCKDDLPDQFPCPPPSVFPAEWPTLFNTTAWSDSLTKINRHKNVMVSNYDNYFLYTLGFGSRGNCWLGLIIKKENY